MSPTSSRSLTIGAHDSSYRSAGRLSRKLEDDCGELFSRCIADKTICEADLEVALLSLIRVTSSAVRYMLSLFPEECKYEDAGLRSRQYPVGATVHFVSYARGGDTVRGTIVAIAGSAPDVKYEIRLDDSTKVYGVPPQCILFQNSPLLPFDGSMETEAIASQKILNTVHLMDIQRFCNTQITEGMSAFKLARLTSAEKSILLELSDATLMALVMDYRHLSRCASMVGFLESCAEVDELVQSTCEQCLDSSLENFRSSKVWMKEAGSTAAGLIQMKEWATRSLDACKRSFQNALAMRPGTARLLEGGDDHYDSASHPFRTSMASHSRTDGMDFSRYAMLS